MTRFEALVIASLAAAFTPAVLNMASVWASVEYFAHGFLVPLVAVGVAWTGRQRRRSLAATSDLRGAILLLLALVLYAFGLLGSELVSQGLAVVVALAGAVLLLRGTAWLRALAFPMGFLLFMIPLPSAWITPVIARLQLVVSEHAVSALQAMKLPVGREGNVIVLPNGALFVAEACSGITSIVTLLPVAVLLGYYTQKSLIGKLALLTAVVPLAMVANLLRVVLTAVAALSIGAERATASGLHQSAGALIYLFGCFGLLGVDWAVRRLARARAGA